MRSTIKKIECEKGFSLVELAISLIVIGILLVPAIYLYSLYVKNLHIEKTEQALLEAQNAIGDFRSIYGRYPCPARRDLTEGDMDYGYESRNPATGDCIAVAGGVEIVNSVRSGLADPSVYIGTLPFRQMNLPDNVIHDGYGNRMTYAVTGLMANDQTYENTNGGISIIGLDGNSVITPDDSAHFVVLTHNQMDNGAISRGGVMVGTCPAGPENENCDYTNSVFRAGEKTSTFDDLLSFSNADSIEQWQLSNTNLQDIHLRRADNVALGADETTVTSGFQAMHVLDEPGLPGTIAAERDAVSFTSGALLTNSICDQNDTDCFPTSLIAGQIANSEGIKCPPGQFIESIEFSSASCTDEITFSCPDSKFITGFNASGSVVCDVLPPPTCLDQTLTTTCGDNRNVTAFYDSGLNTWFGYGYSGKCHKIDPLDTTILSSAATLTDVYTYINGLNNSARTEVDCGPTSADALVRDTFQCNSGSWNTAPVRTLERNGTSSFFGLLPPLYNTSPYPIENTDPPYNPATPMSVDPGNGSFSHDCWCREDYIVSTAVCGGSFTGFKFRILKHTCPQTNHGYKPQVYPSWGYDTHFCTCVPGPALSLQTCAAYFGIPTSIGVVGTAVITNNVSCPSGASSFVSADTSACSCPARSTITTTTACPVGYTNSFTYNGTPYTGINKIYETNWHCPGGPAPVNPISSAAEAGYYDASPTLVHTEPCVCDPSAKQPYHQSCPAGYVGSGIDYLLPFNCVSGTFDPPSAGNMVSNDCHQCVWQPGTPRAGTSTNAAPVKVGNACPTCAGTSTCYDVVSPGNYKLWDGCYCAGQP